MSALLDRVSLRVNGDVMAVGRGLTVAGLMTELGLDTRKVAVERNREIVPRSTYAQVLLDEGDEIEVVHFIGGG